MKKELIDQIVSRLYEMTKLKEIIWSLEKKYHPHYTYTYLSEDGETKFRIELSVDENNKLYSHEMWFLYIYNKNLSEGQLYVYSRNNHQVNKLVVELFNQYTLPNLISVNQEIELNMILNSLDKRGMRNNKIEKILTDKDT